MKTLLTSFLVLTLSALAASAVEKTDLFEAGKEGYALYRIPGIVVTKQGTVLAYCEARKSDRGDWGPIDVLMRRSTDGGKTWGPRQKIVHVEGDLPINPLAAAQNLDKPGDNTVNNPVAIVDHETGAVHFLYCLEYMRCFYMRSDDDGATWTEPIEITKTFEDFRSDYDWKVLATGLSHAIQLTHGPKRGRLVVPVWLSLGTGGHAHRPSVTATVYSDDHGKTWQRGEIAVPDTPKFIYPNETVVVQLADGSVMLNTRSESKAHRRLVTIGPDGATGWSHPRFDEQLLEPICMAGIVRVRRPQGDQPGVIAFSNPHNLSRADGKETPGKNRDRKNVTIKLSDDEGRTWSASRTLEEGFSGYSDLTALPDGTILCFYERGSTDGKNHYRTGRLTVARVTEDWVRDGIEADVCVYGGTSGGVVAAVQAARMGKRVVLVEPGRHLGGMTSGGLSAVDIGEPRSVGGIAREYFSRLVASYGKSLNWNQPFKGKGGPATGGAYSIEPHVAERVFEELVKEAGVTVLRDARLVQVKKEDARIVELTTDDGRTIRAKMFLDTTYEGDLLAAAGVSYTVMREGNTEYGETYNGIHYAEKYKPRVNHRKPGKNGRVPGGQGVWDRDFPLDPYVVKGDPTSGLLPLVSEGEPGKPGDPGPGVMAYCFRLCLSTANDRLPIEPPSDYDPKDYELVARFIAACQKNGDDMDLRWFSKHDPLPNQKWDFNTATFGGNLPGASWEWPEASYYRRAEIAKEIENYHRGLLHFLATDPRVPKKVRTDAARFGLPRDEFTDRGGWPHQIYVREGRRMVSDLVLTEHHTFGRKIAPDSIGLGSYGTDIHEIRRIAKDGVVIREGKVAGGRGGFGPYQIGYGAIVPKQSECKNLFATFALSASHSAFASIRMEPVFMVTSQSAATAACLAIDDEVAVQEVDYEKLKTRLLADGQVLSWPPAGLATSAAAPRTIVHADSLTGIVLDDDQAEYQGDWTTSNRQPSPIGASYRHDDNKSRGEKSATFTATIPKAGEYEIRFLFTWHENRSSRTKVTVAGAAEDRTFLINQREPAMKDRVPNALGIFRFEAGVKTHVTVSNKGADGYVIVDGLQILPIELAREERAGKRPSGYAEIEMAAKPVPPGNALADRVALSPLAKETRPTKGGENAPGKLSAEEVASPASHN
ncbi:MAG: FAD-dependent oxidoreductase [Planctomycetota bacterium]|nr:FAD-dependent oxidoreductase [Planctomycetota bacterium]MDA1250280.1 FAD-dependent oxidoreductase [Planctomycetota bacterium]